MVRREIHGDSGKEAERPVRVDDLVRAGDKEQRRHTDLARLSERRRP